MKRNNIFMWAYITFIVICVCVRLFIDFSLWTPIVLAIAISGVFFAIEDLFETFTRFLDNYISVLHTFVFRARENINKDLAIIAKVDEKAKSLEVEGKDISSIQESFSLIKSKVEEMNGILQLFEEKLNQRKQARDKSKKMTSIFAYLGFLCLLGLMVLLSYFDVPILIQEIVTVFPFAVILITKQISEWATERLKQEMINSQNVIEKYDMARSKLLEAEDKFDYFVSLVENKTEEMWKTSSAD